VATVSGPTVRHPEIVTRLQRMAAFWYSSDSDSANQMWRAWIAWSERR
jgi:hypothetical protein